MRKIYGGGAGGSSTGTFPKTIAPITDQFLTGYDASTGLFTQGGVSVLTPLTIADLQWYFAADLQNESNNVLFQRWTDKNNLKYATATGTGATYKTAQLNGKPAISFPNGVNGRYPITGATIFNAGFSVFVVFKANSVAPAVGYNFIGGNTAAIDIRIDNTGHLALVKTFTAGIGTDTTPLVANTWYQANATYDFTNWAFRVARVAGASGVNAQTITTATNAIGWSPQDGGLDFNGLIAEIVIFNRKLSAVEISQMETYLFLKYGI